jgi:Ca2+-binding RTX toxin-like protein
VVGGSHLLGCGGGVLEPLSGMRCDLRMSVVNRSTPRAHFRHREDEVSLRHLGLSPVGVTIGDDGWTGGAGADDFFLENRLNFI